MSTQFRFRPSTFVKHDDLRPFEANTVTIGVEYVEPKLRKNCNNSVVRKGSTAPLRDGHIVLLAVDALVALHASFKKWRNHRRTLRVLADLDEDQLRDIGLTRGEASLETSSKSLLGYHNNYHALADLDEDKASNEPSLK